MIIYNIYIIKYNTYTVYIDTEKHKQIQATGLHVGRSTPSLIKFNLVQAPGFIPGAHQVIQQRITLSRRNRAILTAKTHRTTWHRGFVPCDWAIEKWGK